jgi:hypothetical protein
MSSSPSPPAQPKRNDIISVLDPDPSDCGGSTSMASPSMRFEDGGPGPNLFKWLTVEVPVLLFSFRSSFAPRSYCVLTI